MKNDLFLRTLRGETTQRKPVWMMRQAGRILPEYRAIRERLSGFKELVETPELACEVTLQPVDLLGVDAAIIFSDILVIPEAMGLSYLMEEKRGPLFPRTIQSLADIETLRSGQEAAAELEYVYQALRLTKRALNDRVPLIGFAGAPFTIFAYMVEGSGSKTFSKAKKMLYQAPEMAKALLDKITEATIAYLQQKIQAGADAIQIFDSWAGVLSPQDFRTYSLPYLERIAKALAPHPVILFAKDAGHSLREMAATGCSALGLGWTTDAQEVRSSLGNKIVLQGNLDPCALYAEPKQVEAMTKSMLQRFGPHHIANLGHGVYPDTPLDGVKAFIETVKSYELD
jgi:uroporphyrinogen decarboxylase